MDPQFQNFVRTSCDYFGLTPKDFEPVSPNLIAPFVLELPKNILTQAQDIASDIHKLTQSSDYKMCLQNAIQSHNVHATSLPSLLSSLDVHVTASGELKIIEINTNASGYLVNAMNYRSRNLQTFPQALEDLQQNFKTTVASADGIVAIIDEKPQQQKLYIEFLMYQKMITSQLGRKCVIIDPSEITTDAEGYLYFEKDKITGIYNRLTDFYLETLPAIKKAYDNSLVLLSPHPWGYASLADKQRMVDVQSEEWAFDLCAFPHFQKALLKTTPFSEFESKDELWSKRHHLFFKPSSSFGSKSVYNGKSVSRKKFEEIYSPGMLAQETAPAPEKDFQLNGETHRLRYDLRFLFFEGKIQQAFARLYQGQLTNLQSPVGGHAPLVFV